MKKKKINTNRFFLSFIFVLLLEKVKLLFKKIKKIYYFNSIIIILLTILIMQIRTPVIVKTKEYIENKKHFSMIKQLEKAKIQHAYFTKALSKEELLVKWIELYSNVQYKMNGDIKYRRADCTTAVFLFLKTYGYRGDILNVTALNKKITMLARANLIKIRKRYNKIELGDLIIFKPNKRGIPHIGIVYEIKNGFICYVDMNGSIGMGFNRIKWGARRINKIAEISFTLWSGDLLQTFDPVAPEVEIESVKNILEEKKEK